MPQTILQIRELQDYLTGAYERAGHHAENINQVILALAGAVVLFKDPNSNLRVRTYRGTLANVLWVTINRTKYALSYNHAQQSVEIRKNGVKGSVVGTFENDTDIDEIIRIFSRLRTSR